MFNRQKRKGERGSESCPYSPLEKVLKQRFKLEHGHTREAYRVCIGFALDDLVIMVPTREREHGFKDGGVEGKKALGNAKETVLDLHTKKDTRAVNHDQ